MTQYLKSEPSLLSPPPTTQKLAGREDEAIKVFQTIKSFREGDEAEETGTDGR